MDFGELLTVAQKNSASKQTSSYYQTKFTPPKKETKHSKALSDNIRKFLAKKDEEERRKKLEEQRKKENLLAMRDHKAQSRINKHLKVCKSANKSVLADAINHEDTAVTMAGPSQPDEDDYGYVSQEASAFYNKLMSKYNNLPPEKPLFSESSKRVVKDIASTKDRVRQALKQHELEESLPHRRKRKSSSAQDKDEPREKESTNSRDKLDKTEKSDKDDAPKPKKRPPMPPPMDFMSLLKLAEQKQKEPIILEPKPKPKVEEPERLMTKRQMKEYQKEREWKEKREREKNGEIPKLPTTSNDTKSSVKQIPSKIPKLNNGKLPSAIPEKLPEKPKLINQVPKRIPDRPIDKPSSSSSKSSAKDELLEERKKLEAEKRELEAMRKKIEEEKRQLAQLSKNKVGEDRNKLVKTNGKLDKPVGGLSKDIKPRQFPPADMKPKQFPPADIKPRQFPPADVRGRQFPPSDVRGRPSSRPMKNNRPINKRRIYDDDDEEEYDSELDDFIDDGPEEQGEDYSKYISEIFGYDKHKYSAHDDDDDNMESNFAQQLKEEYVSTKIGIMEDLEDMKMEAMEKKQKAMMRKKIKK